LIEQRIQITVAAAASPATMTGWRCPDSSKYSTRWNEPPVRNVKRCQRINLDHGLNASPNTPSVLVAVSSLSTASTASTASTPSTH
jgi:hypothetical protein